MELVLAIIAGLTFSVVFIVGSSIVGYWFKELGWVQDDEAVTRLIIGGALGVGFAALLIFGEPLSVSAFWGLLLANIVVALYFSVTFYARYHLWKAVRLGSWWWLRSPEELEVLRRENAWRYYSAIAITLLVPLIVIGIVWAVFWAK
jgi:hypothetical protein